MLIIGEKRHIVVFSIRIGYCRLSWLERSAKEAAPSVCKASLDLLKYERIYEKLGSYWY